LRRILHLKADGTAVKAKTDPLYDDRMVQMLRSV
jgi:hypothetical protein